MIKQEVLKLCKEARKNGYITHSMLLELFKDDEIIPDNWIPFIIEKPRRKEPMILVGSKGYEYFKSVGLV